MREKFSKIWAMVGLLLMGLPPAMAHAADAAENPIVDISHREGVTSETFWNAWALADVPKMFVLS